MLTERHSSTTHSTRQDGRTAGQRELRVAIVGAGKMGLHHSRAIRRLGGLARVVAVADPSGTARDAIRQVWPDAASFSSLEDLLAAIDVDVVHVCTAPDTHERMAMLGLESGAHVYVEKPAAQSATGAERLLRLAKERQRLICAGHQLLFEAPARRLLELLPSTGTVVHIESFFSFRPVRRAFGGGPPLASDLQLLDILPHPVSLLVRLLEWIEPSAGVELAALEVGRAGTVHAIVRRGTLNGTLLVTLAGRPVESYVRVVGTNGTLHADFVRGTVQRLIGPGVSGVDKALNPFRLARQLLFGTSTALGERMLKRQQSYPGLAEIFQAFYTAIHSGDPSPVSADSVIDTARICEQVARVIRPSGSRSAPVSAPADGSCALVTGGTGFLGKAVVEALTAAGKSVRVVGRRLPAMWDRVPGVEYIAADLAEQLTSKTFCDVDVVIHCAAETAGGWEEHRRNSITATEQVLRASAAANVRRLIHVSSLAAVSARNGGALAEDSPLEANPTECGPYIWGKVESERAAERLGSELGVDVLIVRPGALIDYNRFEPPGRLGRRLGNVFVAVGKPSERLGVADVRFAGRTIAWMATHFDSAPRVLNVLAPKLPTRRELVASLRRDNPDLRVVWLPPFVLSPLSRVAVGLQKILRPGKPAVNVAKVFAQQRYDTSAISRIARAVDQMS
jgi:predicted dehydrogenase/nucleoside-diphosphate-sugar epimerase